MDRDDYKRWALDFRVKFPGIGRWLWENTPERKRTRDQFYEDVFSLFALAPALRMNKLLFDEPARLDAWSTRLGEKFDSWLPRLFVRTLNEILGRSEQGDEPAESQGFLIYCFDCMDSGLVGHTNDGGDYIETCCPSCERGRVTAKFLQER